MKELIDESTGERFLQTHDAFTYSGKTQSWMRSARARGDIKSYWFPGHGNKRWYRIRDLDAIKGDRAVEKG